MPFKYKKTPEQKKPFLAYPIPAPVFQTSGTSAGVLSYSIHKSARKYKVITRAEDAIISERFSERLKAASLQRSERSLERC